jgi:hypothetical protein
MFRTALISSLLAALIVTAGCSGFLSDPGSGLEGDPTVTSDQEESDDELRPANGTDLRSINLSDEETTTASGELDGSDPVSENYVYEPVEFEAEAGTVVNITMQAGGQPRLRLVSPNGSVVDVTSAGGPGIARFTSVGLTESGRYTIEATSAIPNATFEYTLSIERDRTLFAGPQSTWNETEKYLEFGRDFSENANLTADNGEFYKTPSDRYLRANASGDYLVIGYRYDPENLTSREIIDIDVSLQLAYENLYDAYANDFAEDSDSAEDESWVPEVIYFRAEGPDGELYNTNFIERRWAQDAVETGHTEVYAARYYSTNRFGPANPGYLSEGGRFSTTDEEFPLETYKNFTYPDGTTHSERYYSDDNSTEN